jgi:hypothetical protein
MYPCAVADFWQSGPSSRDEIVLADRLEKEKEKRTNAAADRAGSVFQFLGKAEFEEQLQAAMDRQPLDFENAGESLGFGEDSEGSEESGDDEEEAAGGGAGGGGASASGGGTSSFEELRAQDDALKSAFAKLYQDKANIHEDDEKFGKLKHQVQVFLQRVPVKRLHLYSSGLETAKTKAQNTKTTLVKT